jgi:hypothetical protein
MTNLSCSVVDLDRGSSIIKQVNITNQSIINEGRKLPAMNSFVDYMLLSISLLLWVIVALLQNGHSF